MSNRLLSLICTMSFCFFSGCRSDVPQGSLPKGQVALTFDDTSVDNWYLHLDLLDSLRIKATFYISAYHTLTEDQKAELKDIKRRGHEIAYHTANHPDLVKEVDKHGMAQTEAKEINSDLALMEADGYTVTNFAYPFGSYSSQLNTWLLRRFKSVRALANRQDYNKSLVPAVGDRKLIYGADVDNNSRLTEHGILLLMDNAKAHNNCLVLVAHQIEKPSYSMQISPERLSFIAKAAAERNLEFVTINSIAK